MSKRSVPAKGSVKDAVFAYFSKCCNEIAEKPAVTMPKGKGIGRVVGAKPEGDATLGKWRCGKCHKKCKVTRAAKAVQETFTQPQETVNA